MDHRWQDYTIIKVQVLGVPLKLPRAFLIAQSHNKKKSSCCLNQGRKWAICFVRFADQYLSKSLVSQLK